MQKETGWDNFPSGPGGEDAAFFRIAHIGDLHLGRVEARGLDHIADWVIRNQAPFNIRLVTHTGDIAGELEDGSEASREVNRVDNTLRSATGEIARNVCLGSTAAQLDLGRDFFLRPMLGIADRAAIGVSMGNHDYSCFDLKAQVHGDSAAWRTRFGDHVWTPYKTTWYAGKSPDDESHCQVFTAGGYTFLNISLEWFNEGSSTEWLESVLKANREKPTIVSTHSYLVPWSTDLRRVSPDGHNVWEVIRRHPQVFLVLSGHVWGRNVDDSVAQRVVQNDAGSDLIETVTDFQGFEPEKGWIRLFTIGTSEKVDNIQVTTVITEDGSFDRSEDFTASIDFATRFGSPAAPTVR